MKNKTNPRRRPATIADVERAANKARDDAVIYCWTILFSVLHDKENHTPEDLDRIWKEVSKLSEAIVDGYVNIADLRDVLKKEAGIEIK